MTYVKDLEEEIHHILQSSSKLRNYNSELRDKYIKQEENFDRERKGWDRDRKMWSKKLGGANTEIQKLRTHDLKLIDEARRLQIENANKDISLAKSKAENDIKSKKIRSLESMIKILEGKLSSAQEDSSLESKVNELEHLKLEAISKPIVGGNNKKNTQSEEQSSITKSDDISTVLQNRPLGNSSNHDTYVSSEESEIRGYASSSKDLSQYFLPRKNDTEIIPKVSDEIDISKTNNNTLQEIPNMTPYLAQPENNMSSLIESNSQMAHSAESLIPPIGTIPIVASTLMSPLSAYIFLILLIIAVMWFIILRRTWGFERKSDQLRNMWARKKKKERESMDEVAFLEYKRNFEAKMKVPTTPHKKELKNKSLVIIEYA
nr:4557_t:CDS:2 [Entrophospora candida]